MVGWYDGFNYTNLTGCARPFFLVETETEPGTRRKIGRIGKNKKERAMNDGYKRTDVSVSNIGSMHIVFGMNQPRGKHIRAMRRVIIFCHHENGSILIVQYLPLPFKETKNIEFCNPNKKLNKKNNITL